MFALAPSSYEQMPHAGDGKGYRPGDWERWMHHDGICPDWDACQGFLFVWLPCGHGWDVAHRASNCALKSDRKHRCWIVVGEPPNITVNKSGPTCNAGSGSIRCGCGWHGWLESGHLREDPNP